MADKKADKTFKVGDLVFAKVRGYRPWPGQIIEDNSNKYRVLFFGTGETGSIKKQDLFLYAADTKQKFAAEKTLKRADFCRAMTEIESAALNGVDPPPIDDDDDTKENVIQTTGNETKQRKEIKEEEPEEKPACKLSEFGTVKRVVPTRKCKQVVRYFDSPKQPVPKQEHANNIADSSSDRSKTNNGKYINKSDVKPAINKPITKDKNYLMAYLPTNQCVGIDINYGKPESFENAEEERAWFNRAQTEAQELKTKLETGQVSVKAVLERVALEPSNAEITQEEGVRFFQQLKEQERLLIMEKLFNDLTEQIPMYLGLRRANVGKCIYNLEKIKELALSKTMLLRNPKCVNTIRGLQNYVGNLKLWKMNEVDEQAFKEQAEKIRRLAAEIYNNIKDPFDAQFHEDFWKNFRDEVNRYKELTKHLPETVRLTISENNYNTLVAANIGIAAE